MSRRISLAIAGLVAGILWLAAPQQAASQTYRVAQADTFDTGRCFNRCIHRRGLRPASMRIRYCSRRCQ
jgi:NADH:ubiquinone oxidoreductase subunit F (NADH-binding)